MRSSGLGRGHNLRKHGLYKTPEHKAWKNMKSRCGKNPTANAWHGGKGIKVCERWTGEDGFINFYNDMGKKPKGLTLERKDSKKDYTPENCKWASNADQSLNTKLRGKALHRGVVKVPSGKFQALISIKRVNNYLGTFETLEEAAEIYLQKYFELHKKWPPEYNKVPLCYKSPLLWKGVQ